MRQFILKEKIKEIINGRKVIAALFYTFNFDPKFFENFVMPILVGEDENRFKEEEIYNKIIWRNLQKEDKIPPITIYCDFFAKDNTQAPTLGYDLFCIKMPEGGNNICNFHPKNIYLLLEDEKEALKLLIITGSGNITPNGWCENFECFSFFELEKKYRKPTTVSTIDLQKNLDNVNYLISNKRYTVAEDKIYDFLRYVDDTALKTFSNFKNSFQEFLEQNIFPDSSINEAEIISPYFSNNTDNVDFLLKNGIKSIKCLLPTLKDNEIQLNKDLFEALNNKGVNWCKWETITDVNGEQNNNLESRNTHAKIYKFYGEGKIYTIIGSVNFTNPAWANYNPKHNNANIESAVLYVEKNTNTQRLLRPLNLTNWNHYKFIEKESLENTQNINIASRNAPDLYLCIDWQEAHLEVNLKKNKEEFFFNHLFESRKIENGFIKLDKETIKSLAKKTSIEVFRYNNGQKEIFTFYIHQENSEFRPIGFRWNTVNILRYWESLGDEYKQEKLRRKIADTTDESGIIDEDKIEKKSLLNEIASNYSALIKLDKYLFETKPKRKEKLPFNNLRYYLLSENIDTLPYYINELLNQLKDGKIQYSFAWMVLNILREDFYLKVLKWEYKNIVQDSDWREFKKSINLVIQQIDLNIKEISKNMKTTEQENEWIKKQLKANLNAN